MKWSDLVAVTAVLDGVKDVDRLTGLACRSRDFERRMIWQSI